ncbi:family 78 glycoside hydrolase catalytic domain [Bacteroidota bacterium]
MVIKQTILQAILFCVGLIIIIGCLPDTISSNEDFANAKWIAYEVLPDSMKIFPGSHTASGNKTVGDKLGDKGLKRSVIPMFRKEFYIDDVKQAFIDICGLGHYELYINGSKVGDRFLSPGWTDYTKRYLFNTFDITEYIRSGNNTIGVIVGNGFFNINRERYRKLIVAYGYPRLIFNITLTKENGSVEQVVSDENCKASKSPITYSSIYGGEDYDARLEQDGWAESGFNDSHWNNVLIVKDTIDQFVPEKDYPLKIIQEFEVKNILTSKTGRTIYDFGQNTSGTISIKVKGNRGAVIRIKPDELINNEGNVTQRSGGGPYKYNYTLRGEGLESWQPKFTYYGLRYADVDLIEPEGATENSEILDIRMLHTRNASPTVGSFSCSDTLFNQVFDLINWGIKNNLASVITDCPHREKLGWLEVPYLMGTSIHYNYDVRFLYNKVIDDMLSSQLENGMVPNIAPAYMISRGAFRDSPEWGSASVIIPWLLYKLYGDKEAIVRSYFMMKRYVEYLNSKTENHILSYGLGDWFDLGPDFPGEAQLTPKAVTATSIFYYDLKILIQTAGLLGYKNDVIKYEELSRNVKKAFLEAYFQPNSGVVSTGSQTAYAMPLYTGLIPEEHKPRVFTNLVESIINNNYALTSGDIGYHFLVRVLSHQGRSDILYKMNNRTDVPGYGYQLKKGATSLTESWAALPSVSNNHMMLGHLMEWFYNGLGGIYQDENSIAYNRIVIAPKPVGNIHWVNCSFNSPKGLISSNWKLDNGKYVLNVKIPEETEARIVLPVGYNESKCSVTNLKDGNIIEPGMTDRSFHLPGGSYEISTDQIHEINF